jgi:hypothetical protein
MSDRVCYCRVSAVCFFPATKHMNIFWAHGIGKNYSKRRTSFCCWARLLKIQYRHDGSTCFVAAGSAGSVGAKLINHNVLLFLLFGSPGGVNFGTVFFSPLLRLGLRSVMPDISHNSTLKNPQNVDQVPFYSSICFRNCGINIVGRRRRSQGCEVNTCQPRLYHDCGGSKNGILAYICRVLLLCGQHSAARSRPHTPSQSYLYIL